MYVREELKTKKIFQDNEGRVLAIEICEEQRKK